MARQYKVISGDGTSTSIPMFGGTGSRRNGGTARRSASRCPMAPTRWWWTVANPTPSALPAAFASLTTIWASRCRPSKTAPAPGPPRSGSASRIRTASIARSSFHRSPLCSGKPKKTIFTVELVRAYNEFLAEEYMAAAPDRLICMGTIPITGLEDAMKELEHCAKLGFKGVKLERYPSGKSYPTPKTTSFGPRRLTSRWRSPITMTATWDQEMASRTFCIRRSPGLTFIRKMRSDSLPALPTRA